MVGPPPGVPKAVGGPARLVGDRRGGVRARGSGSAASAAAGVTRTGPPGTARRRDGSGPAAVSRPRRRAVRPPVTGAQGAATTYSGGTSAREDGGAPPVPAGCRCSRPGTAATARRVRIRPIRRSSFRTPVAAGAAQDSQPAFTVVLDDPGTALTIRARSGPTAPWAAVIRPRRTATPVTRPRARGGTPVPGTVRPAGPRAAVGECLRTARKESGPDRYGLRRRPGRHRCVTPRPYPPADPCPRDGPAGGGAPPRTGMSAGRAGCPVPRSCRPRGRAGVALLCGWTSMRPVRGAAAPVDGPALRTGPGRRRTARWGARWPRPVTCGTGCSTRR